MNNLSANGTMLKDIDAGNIIYSFVKPNRDIEKAYRICEEAFYEAEKYGYKTYARRLL